MALNLFTKTYLASINSSQSQKRTNGTDQDSASFLICEQDDARVDQFISDLGEKGGDAMVGMVRRVRNGKE